MRVEDRVVIPQATALAALLWPGRSRWRLPRPVTALAVAATAAGGALALAGARPHGSALRPWVRPEPGVPVLRDGPYRLVRHPIYAGLLLGGAGFAVLRRRPEPLLAWGVLAAVLRVKTAREEQLLEAHFGSAYREYRDRTPRFGVSCTRQCHG